MVTNLRTATSQNAQLGPVRIKHRRGIFVHGVCSPQALAHGIPDQVTEILAFHSHNGAIDILDDRRVHLLAVLNVGDVADFAVSDEFAVIRNGLRGEDVVARAHADSDACSLALLDRGRNLPG